MSRLRHTAEAVVVFVAICGVVLYRLVKDV